MKRYNKGFTLLEMLVIIVIVSIMIPQNKMQDYALLLTLPLMQFLIQNN